MTKNSVLSSSSSAKAFAETHCSKKAQSSGRSGMGANLFEGGCSFRVWAPNAKAVSVCVWQGDSSGERRHQRTQTFSLVPDSASLSYWSTDVKGVVAIQAYRFLIENKGEGENNPGGLFSRVDAYARQVENASDDAKGIVVDYQQTWSEFATPHFDDLIIYQAHVGSFAGLHDHLNIHTYASFDNFQTKLGYIRDLGFNAIQLLPIAQVDGLDSEGYGATNLFAPHDGYGSPEKLRSLVDAAHRIGLAVLFDVVYHHASTSQNHYWQYDGNTTDGGGIYFEAPFRVEPSRDEDARSFAQVIAVVNMSDRQWENHDYGLHMGGENGQWKEIFNSQSSQYGGWNNSGNYDYHAWVQEDGKLYINVPKWSMLILKKQ